MYLATLSVVSALFYGVEQSIMGDISDSFLSSLIGTLPVKLTKRIFLKSKPTVVSSEVKEQFAGDEIELSACVTAGQQRSDVLELPDTVIVSDRLPTLRSSEMTERYRDAISTISKDKRKTTVATVHQAFASNEVSPRVKRFYLVEYIRFIIFHSMYPHSNKYKKVAWVLMAVWTAAAVLVALVYGLQFDTLNVEAVEGDDCFESLIHRAYETPLTAEYVEQLKAELASGEDDDYSASLDESSSWLIALAQSLVASVLLWQPLNIYISTWIKIWLFTVRSHSPPF